MKRLILFFVAVFPLFLFADALDSIAHSLVKQMSIGCQLFL